MITVKIEISLHKKDLHNHDELRGQVLIALNNAIREYRYEDSKISTQVGIEDIMNIVLEDYPDLTPELVKKATKEPHIVEVRYFVYYFCHKYTNYSFAHIGKKLGGFNHSSVIKGVTDVEGYIDVYPSTKKRIQLIDIKINDLINRKQNHPLFNERTEDNTQP